MSSAVVSTSAALRRPFIFEEDSAPELSCHPERSGMCAKRPSRAVEGSLPSLVSRLASIVPASHLEIRPAPEMASSGISALDLLTGGFPRGCLTEICGPASSGRTTVLLAALAASTRRGEYCVLLDASDVLDPHSVAAAGVELDRLLWVRCNESSPQRHRDTEKTKSKGSKSESSISASSFAAKVELSSQASFNFDRNKSRVSEHRLEQLLRAADMLLESGGFGLIALDLCDLPLQVSRRIPLTTWFRYRRAVEYTPTVLLAIEQYPIAGSCSSLLLRLGLTGDKLAEEVSQSSLLHAKNPGRSAAERQKNAAHGASRGLAGKDDEAPEGRKKNCSTAQILLDLQNATHTQLLTGLEITVEQIGSRLERKPSRSTSIAFTSKTAWAG